MRQIFIQICCATLYDGFAKSRWITLIEYSKISCNTFCIILRQPGTDFTNPLFVDDWNSKKNLVNSQNGILNRFLPILTNGATALHTLSRPLQSSSLGLYIVVPPASIKWFRHSPVPSSLATKELLHNDSDKEIVLGGMLAFHLSSAFYGQREVGWWEIRVPKWPTIQGHWIWYKMLWHNTILYDSMLSNIIYF